MTSRLHDGALTLRGWLILFGAAFALRLLAALSIDAAVAVDKNVDVFATVATNIASGYGFVVAPGEPAMWRAPLYPYLLAGLFAFCGPLNEIAVLGAQAAIDAASALIAFTLARSLFGAGIGFLTLAAVTLFPLSAYYTLRMLPEALFTLALIAAVTSFRGALAKDTTGAYIRVGILGAVATLVKPIGLLLVPVYGLILLAARRPRPWQPVAIMLLCQALAIAPWTVRNWVVSGHFIPVATGAGFSLWVGNNLITGGVEEVQGDALIALDRRMRSIAAAAHGEDPAAMEWEPSTGTGHHANITPEADRAFAREALRQMMAHPTETLAIMGRKVVRLWFSIGRLQNRWAQGYVALVQGALLTLAGWGIVIAWRRGLQLWPLLVPIAYFTAIHALTFSTLRYSMPLMPLVIMFAVFGTVDLSARALGALAIERPAWLEALLAER